jgi:hypothetical protein
MKKTYLWMLQARRPFQILFKRNVSEQGTSKHWNKAIKNQWANDMKGW